MARSRMAFCAMIALAVSAATSHAQTSPGFHDRIYKDKDGKEAKYVVFVPHGYDASKATPIVLFLHGAGMTGEDGKKQATTALGKAIKEHPKAFPFLVVFPQSQKRTWLADSEDGKRALAILDEVEKEYKTDPKRVYLTGLSMGGFGTWSMAAKFPNRWAAIIPICGGGNPQNADKIKDIPCWCFHGADDPTVKPERSREMIEAIKKVGGQPKYTEYPGVKHDSWIRAYATPELYSWMLQQKLK